MGDLTGLAGLAAAAGAAAGFTGGIATFGPTLVLGMPLDSEAFRSNFGLGCPEKIKTKIYLQAHKKTPADSPASWKRRWRTPT